MKINGLYSFWFSVSLNQGRVLSGDAEDKVVLPPC
jgi:hypothetical protein